MKGWHTIVQRNWLWYWSISGPCKS